MSDDISFVDTENFAGHTENISFRDIVLNHVKIIENMLVLSFVGGIRKHLNRV